MRKTWKRQKIHKGQEHRQSAREWIMEAYTVLLLAVFPFYNSEHYFSILSDRAGSFQTMTLLMVMALIAEQVLYGVSSIKQGRRPLYAWNHHADIHGTEGITCRIRAICRRIPPEYAFLGAFLLINVISALLSEYPQEAWSGEAGRLQGSSMWLVYGIAFYCTAHFFRLKKRHMYLFLASGTVVALWGICDYMGPGLSWWLADVKETQKHMFTSSIGNINTYTALIAIYFSLSGAYIVHAGALRKSERAALMLAFFLFSEALITGRSDNAVIGIAVFFLILPFGISNTRQMARYLWLLAVFSVAFPAASILSAHMQNPYLADPDGILLRVSGHGSLLVCAAAIGLAAVAAGLLEKEKPLCGFKMAWTAVLAISGILLVLVFLDANFLSGPGRYGAAGAYLKFSDGWGTYRGLCWRLAYESYAQFPFIKKLIGSGPETFGIIMKEEYYQAMIQGCGQVFDSPHNEFIQYLFCTGILGAACYYEFLASCFFKGVRRDAARKAVAAAILTYVAVSSVNISVPITQPYLIMLAAWCSSKHED